MTEKTLAIIKPDAVKKKVWARSSRGSRMRVSRYEA